jgi:hypothetical protein
VTRGNIAELAATTFVALIIALLSVRTIKYAGEQRGGGEGVSQSPLKDKAFLTFSDQSPPFELRPKTGVSPSIFSWKPSWLIQILANHSISVGGGQQGWLAFGLAGIVPVTLLLLTTREPARREIVDVGKQVNEKAPPIREVFSYLFVESVFYAPFILGVCAIFLVFYAVNAWFPAFLIRQFALSASEAGMYLGPAFIAFGIAGSLGSQPFLRRLTSDNIVPRIVLSLGGICLVQIGNLAVLPFATSPLVVVCVYGVGVTGAVHSVMLVPHSVDRSQPHEGADDVHRLLRREPA